MIPYGFTRELDRPFDEVIARVPDALQAQGFGVITKFDLSAKFKEKLGVDFRKYIVFGACNPPAALKAVCAEDNIGLLLPCNLIVYEKDGKTIVGVIKPSVTMQAVNNDALAPLAQEIEEKLRKVLESI
jgi:uncharacterized protein (DUF302 family)